MKTPPPATEASDAAMWTADPMEALRRIEAMGGSAAYIARECIRRQVASTGVSSVGEKVEEARKRAASLEQLPSPAAAAGGDSPDLLSKYTTRRDNWLRELDNCIAKNDDIGAAYNRGHYLQARDIVDDLSTSARVPVLDKPATIRSTTFGVGVKWATVIERAQREHEYQKQEKLERKNAAPAGGFVVVHDVGVMDIKSPALQIRYGADYLDGWNSCRDAMLATAQPSTKDGVRGCDEEREVLGQLVRLEWMDWAREQPNCKPSWLVTWEELSEPDREVDRLIGERIAYTVRKQATTASGLVDGVPIAGGVSDEVVEKALFALWPGEHDAHLRNSLWRKAVRRALQSVWPGQQGEDSNGR